MQAKSIEPPDLPAPIAAYFADETTDPEAVARCFTEDALVVDERHEHRGRAAIAAWNAAASAKYRPTTDVLAATTDAARTTVRARVSGDFPGSPIELRFHFWLVEGLIARLEVAP